MVVRAYTPELVARCRYRYEETDEPVEAIIADLGIHIGSFYRLVRRWGWKLRKQRPPQDISSAQRILIEAERAIFSDAAARIAASDPAEKRVEDAAAPDPPESAPLSIAERLERAVEKELLAVEVMRAQFGGRPQTRSDAERTARTLASLTDTLSKVKRLRQPERGTDAGSNAGSHDDIDLPPDIDEFRRALAQRIELFVRTRADAGVARTGEPGGGAAAQ